MWLTVLKADLVVSNVRERDVPVHLGDLDGYCIVGARSTKSPHHHVRRESPPKSGELLVLNRRLEYRSVCHTLPMVTYGDSERSLTDTST